MAKKNKKNKTTKVPIGADLWQTDKFCFTCMGTKEDVTLYLTQELWHEDEEDINTLRSMHILEVDACGTTIRLPVESARQLFHALGTVLEED